MEDVNEWTEPEIRKTLLEKNCKGQVKKQNERLFCGWLYPVAFNRIMFIQVETKATAPFIILVSLFRTISEIAFCHFITQTIGIQEAAILYRVLRTFAQRTSLSHTTSLILSKKISLGGEINFSLFQCSWNLIIIETSITQ